MSKVRKAWKNIGFFAVSEDGKRKAIIMPSFCANCEEEKQDIPLEKVKQFETFEVENIIFKEEKKK